MVQKMFKNGVAAPIEREQHYPQHFHLRSIKRNLWLPKKVTARFMRRNGRKNTFERPKVVSEVIFPRFWGVVCIEKCFRIFVSVIGSVVSEMSKFA